MRVRSLLPACVFSLLVLPVAAQANTATDDFTVKIEILAACSVTAGAGSEIDLQEHETTATNIAGSSNISVTCSKNTPYYIGLTPGNDSTTGAGAMTGPGDPVEYQLRSASGMAGQIWGDTATSTAVGNGVGGTGNGSAQSHTVYATVDNANYEPGEYSDSVQVTVNF